jgi:hypothetical protein
VKFLKTFVIAFFLLGFNSVSTSFPDNTGQSHSNGSQSNQNIWSVYKEIGGYSADTLGVVPDDRMFVLTDLVSNNYSYGVELWGDSNLKLKAVFQEQIYCNFTTGIPFHSGETIWINNSGSESIYLTVNGYFQQ